MPLPHRHDTRINFLALQAPAFLESGKLQLQIFNQLKSALESIMKIK